jgi:hypothetical protein
MEVRQMEAFILSLLVLVAPPIPQEPDPEPPPKVLKLGKAWKLNNEQLLKRLEEAVATYRHMLKTPGFEKDPQYPYWARREQVAAKRVRDLRRYMKLPY